MLRRTTNDRPPLVALAQRHLDSARVPRPANEPEETIPTPSPPTALTPGRTPRGVSGLGEEGGERRGRRQLPTPSPPNALTPGRTPRGVFGLGEEGGERRGHSQYLPAHGPPVISLGVTVAVTV